MLEPSIVVLYSNEDSRLVRSTDVTRGARDLPLEAFHCDGSAGNAATVIVSGHSLPPTYLHHDPAMLSVAVACLQPQLIVLDTCYGFSEPLLQALADTVSKALVVGATFKLPPRGLEFEEGFYTAATAEARARFVRARSGAKLERWWLDPDALKRAVQQVAQWDVATLRRRLKRRHPNLVFVPLDGASMLMPIPPERFRQPSTTLGERMEDGSAFPTP